jgi:DNA-binding CsgD family transcriptional regulator
MTLPLASPHAPATVPPERLSDLIGTIYDSALADRQWKRFMEMLCEWFPGCAVTSMASDGEDQPWQYEYAGASPEEIAFVHARLETENDVQRIGYERFLALPPGFVVRSRKYLGDDLFHATTLYRNVLRPMGFGHYMQMKLGANGERFIYLFLSFRQDAPDHERLYDELFALLTLVAPHILRAARIARAMRLSREATQLLAGSLDAIILPMAVVDGDGGLVFANAAGQRMIDRGGVFGIDADGRLTLPAPHETRRLRHRLGQIDAAGRPGGMRAHQGDEAYSLLVMPFYPSLDRDRQLDGALYGARRAFAVFVGQTEEDAIDPGLIGDVFALSAREAEICRDLLHGRSPAEIAAQSGRSPKTVRNQIQSIHEKLGVEGHRGLFDRLAAFRAVSHVLSDVERGASAGGGTGEPRIGTLGTG